MGPSFHFFYVINRCTVDKKNESIMVNILWNIYYGALFFQKYLTAKSQ